MTKEQNFYKTLQDVFIGAKIEGKGGFINLMSIKSNYYRKIEDILKKDIETALERYPTFRDELFDKLYSFFNRYFTESGSIYFNSTPFHNNVYEKVYTDEKDVILFWKTQMLYYVKSERIFRSLPIEFDGLGFYFDASKIESKKANEKRSLIFELKEVREDGTIVFGVSYSEKGTRTKQDEILKTIKRKGIAITEEQLEKVFRVFKKQSEVDFFINKNAKAFLEEQFKLWSYQYFWEGAKEWSADRVNQLQILKDIAFKIIDFISQFEDELVKIWNKPKFVKNSNYVITLDRILRNSPSEKGWQAKPDGVVKWNELPFNPKLKERAKELRNAGNLSEVLFWNQVKNKQFLGLDFDRQKIIGNYIVDFYCKDIGVVIEIDGISHNDKLEYDVKRDAFLKELGLKVFHILDIDIKKNLSGVIGFLKKELNTPSAKADTPLKEGNLLKKILKHQNIKEQIKEWQELGIVEDNFKVEDVFETDLKSNLLAKKYEHLPIDTKYFKDLEFEILSQFDDLDKSLDGWLIKSENYQALNTILPKFKEKVQTIYIDPPFNTNSSPIIYVNKYKDSSWLSMMENRLSISKYFLKDGGINVTAIDDVELRYLATLLDDIFGKENYVTTIASECNPQGRVANKVSQTSEYHIIHARDLDVIGKLFVKKLESRKPSSLKRTGTNSRREQRPNRYYPILLKGEKLFMISHQEYGNIYDSNTSTFDDNFVNKLKGKYTKEGYEFILPIGEKGEKFVWQRTFERVSNEKDTYIVKNGNIFTPAFDIEIPKTLWKHPLYSNPEYGSEYLTNMIGRSEFETPKSYHTIMQFLIMTGGDGIFLDYFGGSGTTAQAVLELNKLDEENGHRKYLVVEMGEYFYGILLPRLKKLCISSKWKNAKPQDSNGMSQFFKYYELEQYEESLANCKYEDGDLFNSPSVTPYQEYVFMKDEKMLNALEIDYEKNRVNVDLSKLYPNIDIPETLSNLTGKWIKKVSDSEVELEDGTKINIKNLDYKLIKPLIWWE